MYDLVGWLVDGFDNWLVGWFVVLADWLICCLVGWPGKFLYLKVIGHFEGKIIKIVGIKSQYSENVSETSSLNMGHVQTVS